MQDAIEQILENVIRRILAEELSKIEKTESPDEIFNQMQACKFLGVSKPTLNKYIRTGQIPVYKLGERNLFKRSQLLSCLDQFKLSIYEKPKH